MKLTSSASFSPSIRISLRLKIHQAQAKNFCRVLDIRVPQVVKTNFRQVTVRNPPAKVVANVLGREQLAIRIDEHIVCVCGPVSALFRSVFLDLSLAAFQPLVDIVRQRECAAARLGLEVVAADKLAFAVNPDFSDLVPDLEGAGLEVDVQPAKAKDLAAAQAVDDSNADDILNRVALEQPEQLSNLLHGECFALERFDTRRFNALYGV